MLMPVREYNKHIAKIPNCKMRQRPTLRATFASLLLLLHVAQALDPAAASGAGGGSGGAAGGAGPASTGGASGGSLSSGPPTLIANLTEQGSPGVYNSTMG
ncbi:WAS/WASL-interacting protein family member 1 isoform X1 [Drosophila rhopaloa]|nr:WAS/WASL-interacting protein family member 1 isoform X1 [Drosophila rhopaloa]XP_044316163.1 WAS/WASL-interacting protein family member 1 isoform X1 [Drosophila rhopaloa]XP_044316164.1 WAS/WASL-interacting protein family member 1 isoform X1 [Drosophila rhopaloa]XP_044316165.1 WAS/WASL-interacting protein family member 1 isoform X1 [Drosophila rhopaloa]